MISNKIFLHFLFLSLCKTFDPRGRAKNGYYLNKFLNMGVVAIWPGQFSQSQGVSIWNLSSNGPAVSEMFEKLMTEYYYLNYEPIIK